MSFSPTQIIEQLEQARNLALQDPGSHPQVLRQILQFLPNPEAVIQKWCVDFLAESFVDTSGTTSGLSSKLGLADKVDLAIDSLDALIQLSLVRDIHIFRAVINISSVVYRFVFKYVAENDGANQIWSKLAELKNSLVNKFQLNFPLEPSDNAEHDEVRNIVCKVELVKFIMIVIDYQSKSTAINGGPSSYSLSNVPSSHSLIVYNNMEYEALSLLDMLLKVFLSEILVAPLITATLNHLIIITKRKPQYVTRVLNIIQDYDTNKKFQSNYQSVEQFKLAKKYVDRVLKIFIQHLQKHSLVPVSYQSALSKAASQLVDRGAEIRKKNIFAIDDPTIRKRKFDGFLNSTRTLQDATYQSLYTLNDVNNELNNFDLTTVPQHILASMVVTALLRALVPKLTKALEIVSDRYTGAITAAPEQPQQPEAVKEEKMRDEDEDDDGQAYNPETVYTLPPPKALSFQEKKDHISIIIKNFFKLASVGDKGNEQDENALTKVAISAWKKDSWVILLTRLATRGMRHTDSESDDANANDSMADMIRTAIFDYFLDNIHARIDLIIEWLNEEWYSEKVYNESTNSRNIAVKKEVEVKKEDESEVAVKKEVEVKKEDDDSVNDTNENSNESRKRRREDEDEIPSKRAAVSVATPIYSKWAGKVLDAMIPFLEPSDRKIFIRLLSDLPYLDADLVGRIKSLVLDPIRSKIGFLSLQFLIMYRPPVRKVCLDILRELTESDQEDIKGEAQKLLEKYK